MGIYIWISLGTFEKCNSNIYVIILLINLYIVSQYVIDIINYFFDSMYTFLYNKFGKSFILLPIIMNI